MRSATFGQIRGEFLPYTANLLLHVPPMGWNLPVLHPSSSRRTTDGGDENAPGGPAQAGVVAKNTYTLSSAMMQQIMQQPWAQSGASPTDTRAKSSASLEDMDADTIDDDAVSALAGNSSATTAAAAAFVAAADVPAQVLADVRSRARAVGGERDGAQGELLSEIFVNHEVESEWRLAFRGCFVDLTSTGLISEATPSTKNAPGANSSVIAVLVPPSSFGSVRFVADGGAYGSAGFPVASSVIEFELYFGHPPSPQTGDGLPQNEGLPGKLTDTTSAGTSSTGSLSFVVSDGTMGAAAAMVVPTSAAAGLGGDAKDGPSPVPSRRAWEKISLPVSASGLDASTWNAVEIRCSGGDGGGCLFYLDNVVVRQLTKRHLLN